MVCFKHIHSAEHIHSAGESSVTGACMLGALGLGAVQRKDCLWHSSGTEEGVITILFVIYWWFAVGKQLQVFGSKPGQGERERERDS